MTNRSVSFPAESPQESEELFFQWVYGEAFRYQGLTPAEREKVWGNLIDCLAWRDREIVRIKFGLGFGNAFHHTEEAVLVRLFKLSAPEIHRILETARTKIRRVATTWREGGLQDVG